MSELLQLSKSWPELAVAPVIICLLMTIMMRLARQRRSMGGLLNRFDEAVLILLGQGFYLRANDVAFSIGDAAAMLAILIVLHAAVVVLTSHSRIAEKLVEGEPTILARDGKVLTQALQREHISRRDFDAVLRKHHVEDVADVELVLLRANSRISVVAKRKP